MAENVPIFITGYVEYVEGTGVVPITGEADAWRIKVRVNSDGDKSVEELPWAFPLLPKVFQSIPKKGEGVLVATSKTGEPNSQRYFLGPIISQPQFQEQCEYGQDGRGPATSLIYTAKPTAQQPLTAISRKKELTKGAFPELEDVAVIGRGQEDIVLKYRNRSVGSDSEIDLRAGVRLRPSDESIKYLKGNVIFNNQDPAYIQVKYNHSGVCGLNAGEGDDDKDKYESITRRSGNGVVNLVADKINLISHKDENCFGEKISDRDNLIKEGELDDIMSKLHRSVYGDELIILLKKIVNALVNHTHPYSMKPPTVEGTELKGLVGYDYEKIISPNVRIS